MAEESLTLPASRLKSRRNVRAIAAMPPAERLATQSKFVESTNCLEFTGQITAWGYGQIYIRQTRWSTHRLAWTLAHGPIPPGMQVLHRCDNPACINPEHLFLGTQADNMKDMARKGRSSRGVKNRTAKLTEEQVLAIRADPRPHRTIAACYGIKHTNVGDIKRGRIWRHVL